MKISDYTVCFCGFVHMPVHAHVIMFCHCSAVVERDAAAKQIMELEKELADVKTELSKVLLIAILSVEMCKDAYTHLTYGVPRYILTMILNCLQKDASSSLAATKELTSLLDKERRDWKIRQTEMVKQIGDLQEECRSVSIETEI